LSQVHQPSKNVNYRKDIGALETSAPPLKVLYIIRCSRWT